jgi:hypothetical protein
MGIDDGLVFMHYLAKYPPDTHCSLPSRVNIYGSKSHKTHRDIGHCTSGISYPFSRKADGVEHVLL